MLARAELGKNAGFVPHPLGFVGDGFARDDDICCRNSAAFGRTGSVHVDIDI